MLAWYDHLSFFDTLMVWFIAYWIVIMIWIKGTDPCSNVIWHAAWWVVKIPLWLCGGLIILAMFTGNRR